MADVPVFSRPSGKICPCDRWMTQPKVYDSVPAFVPDYGLGADSPGRCQRNGFLDGRAVTQRPIEMTEVRDNK